MADPTARAIPVLPNTANAQNVRQHARSHSDVRTGAASVQRSAGSRASQCGTPDRPKADHRGTPSDFISFVEVEAHAQISLLLTARHNRRITLDYLKQAFGFHADSFAPRCNCGRVLRTRAEIGRKRITCSCGFACLEVG